MVCLCFSRNLIENCLQHMGNPALVPGRVGSRLGALPQTPLDPGRKAGRTLLGLFEIPGPPSLPVQLVPESSQWGHPELTCPFVSLPLIS